MFISTASRVWQRNSSMRRWLQSASSRVIEAGLNPPTASLSPNSPARRPSAHTRIGCPEALVIPDATADKRFAGLALVAGPPWVRFYAGTPVMAADGFAVGAVAVMDTHPRGPLSQSDMCSLRDFSALVSRELNRRSSAGDASSILSAIVQSAEDAIISMDLNGIILTWNPGAERLYGYSAAQVLGRPINVIIPSDRREEADRKSTRLNSSHLGISY